MFPSHLFPSFPKERVLYEDADLIVIDKPVNVSTHAPDDERTDDAVSRVRLAVAERDCIAKGAVYLGIHQRLDRDTSGVLLFTRRKSANASIAAQFEKRRVKKTYVAAVVDWPKAMDRGVLKHTLVPGDEGRMVVVPAKPAPRPAQGQPRRGAKPSPEWKKPGQEAVTHYRVLRRAGARALLELSPETGRTHQIRVQVAAVGARIAGDRMYGDVPAVRLMLHATRLELQHPSGPALDVRAPVPAEFDDWIGAPASAKYLPSSSSASFERRLGAAVGARWGLGRASDTTAFRLVNGEGDGLEGIAIDAYGEFLLVHFFSDEALAQKEDILDRVFSLGPRGVYSKVHPKQSNTLVDPRTGSLAPALPVRGEPAPDPLVVFEAGLAYRVRLGDGLKTGIFLDQRENRRRVRELAYGKRVLNLFAYTCPFTVAAAMGGARATVSVDASRAALAWGVENLEQNGIAPERHAMVDEDVFVWLKLAAKRTERYDLVVLDPPSYATTKTSRFSASQDFPEIAARALGVLSPGGRMLACTNHRGIALRKFRKQMHEAGRLAERVFSQLKDLPCPGDFPAPIGDDPHLKSVLITVE